MDLPDDVQCLVWKHYFERHVLYQLLEYRFLTGLEAYGVVRNASEPDDDFEHELFTVSTFWSVLNTIYPNHFIVKGDMYEALKRWDGIRTDFLNHWSYRLNPVSQLVELVIGSVKIKR